MFPWGTVKAYAWEGGQQGTNDGRLEEIPLGFATAVLPTSHRYTHGSVTTAHLQPHIAGRELTLCPFVQEKDYSEKCENASPPSLFPSQNQELIYGATLDMSYCYGSDWGALDLR